MLYKIKEDINYRYVGMDEVKLLTFCLNLTSRTPEDYANQHVLGDSSSGKTHLVESTFGYLPDQWYRKIGRLSATALDYLEDQNFSLLWIQEKRGAAEGASPTLRMSSNSDGGSTLLVTERGEDGKFKANEYNIPGRSIVTTTCDMEIHEEDSTRTWIHTVDMSRDQTVRVIDYQAERARMPKALRNMLGQQREDFRPIVKEALMMLDFDIPVAIPFSREIKGVLSMKVLRARRDYEKLLALIKIIALVHQHQRTSIELEDSRVLVAGPQDAMMAFGIAEESLEETMSGMDKRLRQAIDVIRAMSGGMNPDGSFTSQEGITFTAVGVAMNRSSEWSRKTCYSLENAGVLDVDKSSKPYTVKIRPDGDAAIMQKLSAWRDLGEQIGTAYDDFLSQIPADKVEVVRADDTTDFIYVDPIGGSERSAIEKLDQPVKPEEKNVNPNELLNPVGDHLKGVNRKLYEFLYYLVSNDVTQLFTATRAVAKFGGSAIESIEHYSQLGFIQEKKPGVWFVTGDGLEAIGLGGGEE